MNAYDFVFDSDSIEAV